MISNLVLLALLLPLSVMHAQDLSGLWVGQYKYAENEPDGKHVFTLVVRQTGKVVSGKMIEQNTFGFESWPYLGADIVGEVGEGTIKFYKTYDGGGLLNHVVIYAGKLEGGTITGTWSLQAGAGVFQMKLIDAAFFAAAPPKAAAPGAGF